MEKKIVEVEREEAQEREREGWRWANFFQGQLINVQQSSRNKCNGYKNDYICIASTLDASCYKKINCSMINAQTKVVVIWTEEKRNYQIVAQKGGGIRMIYPGLPAQEQLDEERQCNRSELIAINWRNSNEHQISHQVDRGKKKKSSTICMYSMSQLQADTEWNSGRPSHWSWDKESPRNLNYVAFANWLPQLICVCVGHMLLSPHTTILHKYSGYDKTCSRKNKCTHRVETIIGVSKYLNRSLKVKFSIYWN